MMRIFQVGGRTMGKHHWQIKQLRMTIKPIRKMGMESSQGFITEITADVEIGDGWGNNISIDCTWMCDVIPLKDITAKVNEAVEKVLAGQTDGVRMKRGGFEIVL